MKYQTSLKDWDKIFDEKSYQQEHGKSTLYWRHKRYVFNPHTQCTYLLYCYSEPNTTSAKVEITDVLDENKEPIRVIHCNDQQTAFKLIIKIIQRVQLYDEPMMHHINSVRKEMFDTHESMQLD